MNGGRMLDMELGLRPFYQMLERGECLVILADAPAVVGSAVATPYFLGCRRQMAGGALRMARKTGSDIGAFVCRYLKPGQYCLKGGPIVSAGDPQAFDTVYRYLSDEIEAAPGRWWASDLLPLMTPVDGQVQKEETC
jgi:lauroyl/myristoyl acyltransferase